MRYGLIELHDLYDFNAPNAYREVVMCKECKYYDDDEAWCYWIDESVKADDFCSYGERRE